MSEPISRYDTPFRINLEQQKKRAKELLKAFHSAKNSALLRFKQHHPKYADYKYLPSTSNKGEAQLSDAQLVIARELGLPSWPKLKAHITSMSRASNAIKVNASSPDIDFKTLHIRCGTDLGFTLPAGGFKGDFLEYSDPF